MGEFVCALAAIRRASTGRELVARAFLRLERSGVIMRKRDRVVIHDPARLASLARA
jgi:hypothetical protein